MWRLMEEKRSSMEMAAVEGLGFSLDLGGIFLVDWIGFESAEKIERNKMEECQVCCKL